MISRKALLKELVDAGKLKARSKWKEVYPSFSDDKRYLDMLGNPGSNPLELFWDVVDDLDQKLVFSGGEGYRKGRRRSA